MKLYIISNLQLHKNKKSRSEGKVLSLFILLMVIFNVIVFLNLNNIKVFLPINSFIIILLGLLITTFISAQITILFSTDIREKARRKSVNGTNNQTFSIEKVWGISTGGITPTSTAIGDSLSLKYTTECILFKSLLRNSLEREENVVNSHYASMGKFIDIIMENKFEVEVISMKYNPNNDPIWAEDSNKIAQSNLGATYQNIINTVSNNVFTETISNSNVTVNYYIIRSLPTSLCTVNQLLTNLVSLEATSRTIFSPVNLYEFKTLLEDYFGVTIHLEDLSNYITDDIVILGNTKVIKYSINGIDFTMVNDVYNYNDYLPTVKDIDGITKLEDNVEGLKSDIVYENEYTEYVDENVFNSEL